MGFTLDYFVAELRCPVCGTVSRADESTNMVTYIRDNPQLANLGVGHPLDVPLLSMNERAYRTVRMAEASEPIHILHPWACPTCGTWPLWAEIVVRNGVIDKIGEAVLSRETLDQINFINDESKGIAAALIGKEFGDLEYAEVVPILRRFLPSRNSPPVEAVRKAPKKGKT